MHEVSGDVVVSLASGAGGPIRRRSGKLLVPYSHRQPLAPMPSLPSVVILGIPEYGVFFLYKPAYFCFVVL